MTDLGVILNVICLLTICFWAFYKAHISDRFINRFSFVFIGLTCTIIIISHVVPNNSQIFYQNYIWQRLLFNSSLASRSLVDFYCEYGSPKWVEAFRNSRKKLLRLTEGILIKKER